MALVLVTVSGAVASGPFGWGLAAFPMVGALILWHRPSNTVGWLMVGIGALPSAATVAGEWRPHPLALAEPMFIVTKMTILGFALIPFLVVVFPTGRLPSPRWRWPARVCAAAVAGLTLLEIVRTDTPGNPLHLPLLEPAVRALFPPLSLCVIAFGMAALVNVMVRVKRSTGDEREQLRWFVTSAALFPALMFMNGAAQGQPWQGAVLIAGFTVGIAAIAVGIGVAVLKLRLYAIDIVVNKALVFGALAAMITGVYVAVVAGLGTVVGSSDHPNLALSLVATTIAALAFQPVRDRMQRVANRLVYGNRLSPYEAVASFAHRVAEFVAYQEVLPEMAEAAALSVGAVRSQVRLFLPSGAVQVVSWPSGDEHDDFALTLPVVDGGAAIGEISVAKSAGDAVSANDERLLHALLPEARLAMRGLRLTEELQHRLVELRESRRRLVAAQDDERRRMERDLHDGAQQHLVAMKISLGMAKRLVTDGELARLLDDVSHQSAEALTTLRDLARGLFPEVLAQRGLVAALEAHITKAGVQATVEAHEPIPRLGPQAEANVYFVVREALQNASKYAAGCPVSVMLSAADDGLAFSVTDEGPGFDVATTPTGNGTQNMRDRVEALGGRLEVVSGPGRGTEIRGWVPSSGSRDPAAAETLDSLSA